jgi:hypothetical protein
MISSRDPGGRGSEFGGVSEKVTAEIFSTLPRRAALSRAIVARTTTKQARRENEIQRGDLST